MPRASPIPIPITGRFLGRVEEFGFRAPPVPLRLKLLEAVKTWTLFLQSSTDVPASKIVEWLPTAGLLRIEFGTRHVMRADYHALPPTWATAFRGVVLVQAVVAPDGSASVTVNGSRRGLASFARRVYGASAPLELVQLRAAEPPIRFLTVAQDEALRAAVEAGYYRIPRTLNLDQLAKRLGITSASLSERLRRAEGRIITRYVEAGSASPWDERTIFDATDVQPASIEWPEATATPPPRGSP